MHSFGNLIGGKGEGLRHMKLFYSKSNAFQLWFVRRMFHIKSCSDNFFFRIKSIAEFFSILLLALEYWWIQVTENHYILGNRRYGEMQVLYGNFLMFLIFDQSFLDVVHWKYRTAAECLLITSCHSCFNCHILEWRGKFPFSILKNLKTWKTCKKP